MCNENSPRIRETSRRAVLRAGLAAGALGLASGRTGRAESAASARLDGKERLAMSDSVTVARDNQIMLIGLNRPEKDNRIDPDAYRGLAEAYFAFQHDPSLRAAVLFGHGKSFCRGIDVAAFASTISSGVERTMGPDSIDPFGKSPQRLTKPVVAVVHGETWNIGHELCLAADIRVAARTTDFAQTEAAQARMPGSGATIRFVRDAGWGNAMRYMLTGDHWNAEDARRMGLIQEIADDPQAALALGIQLAQKIAACAPLSVSATIASAHLAVDDAADKALLALNGQRQALYGTRDFEEGLSAVRERRAPVYQGR
jgi:enoyl-CoA hydratase/carnithine racemase